MKSLVLFLLTLSGVKAFAPMVGGPSPSFAVTTPRLSRRTSFRRFMSDMPVDSFPTAGSSSSSDPTMIELVESELTYAETSIVAEAVSNSQSVNLIPTLTTMGPPMAAIIATLAVVVKVALFAQDHGLTAGQVATCLPKDMWHQYEIVLANHPMYTKACTSATVYTIGDIIAQKTEQAGNDQAEVDVARVVRSLLAGLIGHGPMSHLYYNLNENFFDHVLHWHAWWTFLPKIVVDQTLFGPIWNNSYILLLGLMKMDSIETIISDMRRTTLPLVLEGLKLWPLVHCITYGVLPVQHRLLWVDAVEIVWVTILATNAAGGHSTSTTNCDTDDAN